MHNENDQIMSVEAVQFDVITTVMTVIESKALGLPTYHNPE